MSKGTSAAREGLPANGSSVDVPRIAMKPREAAEASGIPLRSLFDMLHREEIAHSVYGRGRCRKRYLIRPEDLEAWLKRHRTPAVWEDK